MIGCSIPKKAWLLALVTLAAGLAGCADADDEGFQPPESYQEALEAPGTEWEPEQDSSITLRMLHPSGETAPQGEHEVWFLLYDSEADEPVEDVTFRPQDEFEDDCSPQHDFCAEMPDMGHGTQGSPEESPEHQGSGVYEGLTTFIMPGEWELHIRPTVDGERLTFTVPITVE